MASRAFIAFSLYSVCKSPPTRWSALVSPMIVNQIIPRSIIHGGVNKSHIAQQITQTICANVISMPLGHRHWTLDIGRYTCAAIKQPHRKLLWSTPMLPEEATNGDDVSVESLATRLFSTRSKLRGKFVGPWAEKIDKPLQIFLIFINYKKYIFIYKFI